MVTTVTPEITRHSRTQWFYGLLRALPRAWLDVYDRLASQWIGCAKPVAESLEKAGGLLAKSAVGGCERAGLFSGCRAVVVLALWLCTLCARTFAFLVP